MSNLHKIDRLQSVIESISNIYNVEVAVFDTECNIVASTDKYIQSKGNKVHEPSIKEVLIYHDVVVNKPGYMKSCMGCRFKDHCPSTIELLNSIRIDSKPIGVLTLTSFSKEGHDRITKNTNHYIEVLHMASKMIGDMYYYSDFKGNSEGLEKIINGILKITTAPYIIIDNKGAVKYINEQANAFFNNCDIIYTKTIYQLFSESILKIILNGQTLYNKRCKIGNIDCYLTTIPIIQKGKFIYSAIKIHYSSSSKDIPSIQSIDKDSVTLDSIIGNHTSVKKLKNTILKLKQSNSTILITGETGTGKGLLAKAIHNTSSRNRGPFVSINCASIPDSLFESELFGYESGAFTGAKKEGKPGKFELAHGGTLFLDEIGELPLHMQAKLLNVVQEQSVERVGGITSIPLDVRIIAATNKDLESMVRDKSFRSDLYFRLNVIPLMLEELSNKTEDIPELIDYYITQYNSRLSKNITSIDEDALNLLVNHSWPGNIRELQNVIEYSMNITDSNRITAESLPPRLQSSEKPSSIDIKSKINHTEATAILAALEKHGWDVSGKKQAASELGIGLRTLYRKLNKLKEEEII